MHHLLGFRGPRLPTEIQRQRSGSLHDELVPRSFPDVDEDEAKRFVMEGSDLSCPRAQGFSWMSCFGSARLHCRVDYSRDHLQWSGREGGCAERAWCLGELTSVRPLSKIETSCKSSKRRSDCHRQCEFTITFGNRRRTLRAGSRKELKFWVTALECMLNDRWKHQLSRKFKDLVQMHFNKTDANDDGNLDLRELKHMLRRLNVRASEDTLQDIIKAFDEDSNSAISQEEFVGLFCKMLVKPDLEEIFARYSSLDTWNMRVMTVKDYLRFKKEVQGETDATEDTARAYLAANLSEPFVTREGAVTEAGFSLIMCRKANSIYDPQRAHLHQDMTRPLSNYWISCSHNTYLEGAQIGGTASVEQYLQVLRHGCRCVEIDLWDGAGGKPVVTHGYTLSGKISFEEVAQSLRAAAFEDSPFPLILSLESHLSLEQTSKVGHILVEAFGDRLLRHPPGGHSRQPLLSPEEARGKVIVKGKPVKLDSREGEECVASERRPCSLAAAQVELQLGITLFNSLIYLVARKMQQLEEQRHPCEISSFEESRALRLCQKHGRVLVAYHRDQLSRIFPPGQNVRSTNLSPLPHWAHGAQLVALNFQTMDAGVILNEGMFREQNGGFGYVLKPPCLLRADDGEENDGEAWLTITMLCAHQLRMPSRSERQDDDDERVSSPLVVVSVHGADGQMVQRETEPVAGTGFSPRWGETFDFAVEEEDTDILTFEVYSQDKFWNRQFVAAAAYPINGLLQGFRWVPLWDLDRRTVANCGLMVLVRKEKGEDSHRCHESVTPRGNSKVVTARSTARKKSSLAKVTWGLGSGHGRAGGSPASSMSRNSV